jgi:uncharacterized phage-like protein YoqJ
MDIVLAGTGHRTKRLGLSYSKEDREALTNFVLEGLLRFVDLHGRPSRVLSGFAQGFDQALAAAALSLDIPVVPYIPFVGQAGVWPAEARRYYTFLLKRCEAPVVVSPGGFSARKMLLRDEALVRAATHLLSLYDGSPSGGTAHTVRFARDLGVPLFNLWDSWANRRV